MGRRINPTRSYGNSLGKRIAGAFAGLGQMAAGYGQMQQARAEEARKTKEWDAWEKAQSEALKIMNSDPSGTQVESSVVAEAPKSSAAVARSSFKKRDVKGTNYLDIADVETPTTPQPSIGAPMAPSPGVEDRNLLSGMSAGAPQIPQQTSQLGQDAPRFQKIPQEVYEYQANWLKQLKEERAKGVPAAEDAEIEKIRSTLLAGVIGSKNPKIWERYKEMVETHLKPRIDRLEGLREDQRENWKRYEDFTNDLAMEVVGVAVDPPKPSEKGPDGLTYYQRMRARRDDEKEVRKYSSTMLGNKNTSGLIGMAGRSEVLTRDALNRVIATLDKDELKVTQGDAYEIAGGIVRSFTGSNRPSAQLIEHVVPHTLRGWFYSVLQYATGKPKDFVPVELLRHWKTVLETQNKFWGDEYNRLVDKSAPLLRPIFDRHEDLRDDFKDMFKKQFEADAGLGGGPERKSKIPEGATMMIRISDGQKVAVPPGSLAQARKSGKYKEVD
jgi:hypothetical protein